MNKDVKKLFDFEELFFGYDLSENNIIQKEDGSLDVVAWDEYKEKYETRNIKSAGKMGEYISMICRLREFGYYFRLGFEIRLNGRVGIEDISNPHELMENYKELKENIEKLKAKYGEDYINHKDEIMRENVGRKTNEISEDELYKKTDELHKKLEENYNEYLKSIDPEEAEKLNAAINIYNSAYFLAINTMLAIPDYQNKNGSELLRECDKSSDFNEHFHTLYKNSVRNLNEGTDRYEKEILEKFSKIMDFSSEEKCIDSLKKVLEIIDKHKDKVKVPQDMLVYRGVSTSEIPDFSKLAKGEIISTSLRKGAADMFTHRRNTSYTYLEYIFVEKGTPYLMPLNRQGREQQEIMFSDSTLQIDCIGNLFKDSLFYQNGAVQCYKIKGKEKQKEKDFKDADNLKEKINSDDDGR